jgi:MFS family permease
MVLVQGPILTRLSRKWSDRALVVVGALVLSASFLLLLSFDRAVLYLGAVLLAIGNGLMWPSIVALLSKTVPSEHQGTVQGFAGSLGAVASIIGLLAGGVLYASVSNGVFIVSSLTIAIVLILAVCISV